MLLVYGLTRAPNVGWLSAETIGAFVGSAVPLRPPSTSSTAAPPADLRIFRRRTLAGANVIGLLLGTILFGMFFLLTPYQQDVPGYSLPDRRQHPRDRLASSRRPRSHRRW